VILILWIAIYLLSVSTLAYLWWRFTRPVRAYERFMERLERGETKGPWSAK
jgi:hypothetical protein